MVGWCSRGPHPLSTRDGGWERCEVEGADAVVAVGLILIQGERATVEIRSWSRRSYPPFAMPQARILRLSQTVFRLEWSHGMWQAVGVAAPVHTVTNLYEWW